MARPAPIASRLKVTYRRPGPLGWTSLVIAILLLFPIAAVVSSVFDPAQPAWAHLAQTLLGTYVWNTLLMLAGVSVGVVSIGVLSAWLVTAYRFPGQRLLEWALVLPLALPAYVMAYAYTDWLQFTGPVQTSLRAITGFSARDYWFPEIRSIPGAAAILAFALYPYVYLIARTAFLDLSRSAIEAGRLAGYSVWGSFFRVAIPLARPAIVAGIALALMEALADYGTVSYFELQVFTTGIFKAWFALGDSNAAAQLASCLLGFVAVALALERTSRGRAAYYNTGNRRPTAPAELRGFGALLALAACAAPIVFGFLLPVGILVHLAWENTTPFWSARLVQFIGNSFTVAGVTAITAILVAIVMAYATRLSKNRAVATASRIAALGYAIPGTVIAVGVLVPLARLDNWLASWIENAFGLHVGLLLTGTIVALVYAYLVRFLAIALQPIEAGLTRVTPSMDDAARSLGASPTSALARVHAPLLASSLLTAGLLVFVDVMKELPATLALRPFNFDTLAVAAYQFAKDERLADAAVPSLVIALVGLLPLIFVSRQIIKSSRH